MVSVVIPVYNDTILILEMIDCMIAQSYEDWELIVVDDCSVDDTFGILKEYCKADNRIKIIQRDRLPKGAPTCRNIGLEKASGEYIVFFDSDDLISLSCLKNRVEFMEENKEIDFGVFPAKTFQNRNDIESLCENDVVWGVNPNSLKSDLSLFLATNYPYVVWTNIYRREVLDRLNIAWDEKIAIYQDFDFNISVVLNNLRLKYYSDQSEGFDYFYRIQYSLNSISSAHVTKKKFKSTVCLFSKVVRLLRSRDMYEIFKDDLYVFIYFYFKRLLLTKSFEYLPEYLTFCKSNFSGYQYFKIKISSSFLKVINNEKLFKITSDILFFILFAKEENILNKKSTIERLINKIKSIFCRTKSAVQHV